MAVIHKISTNPRRFASEFIERNEGVKVNGSSANGCLISDKMAKKSENKAAAIILLDKNEVIILIEGSGLDELNINKYEMVGGHIHESFTNNPQIISVISKAVKNRKIHAAYEIPGKCFEISLTYNFKSKNELNGIIAVVFETSQPHLNSKDSFKNSYLEQLFVNLPDAAVILDSDDNIINVNSGFERLFGCENNLIKGENIYSLIQPEHLRTEIKEIRDSMLKSGNVHLETERINSSGEFIDVSLTGFEIEHNGEISGSVQIYRDITNIKDNKESIVNALLEKEMLLKEIHHRVKNNLQIVSSLLFLQTKTLKDEEMINVILESQNRVKSIALIHEKLYQSKNLARIDFDIYLRTFIPHIVQSFGKTNRDVSCKIKAGNIYLNPDTAIPCGLIINEIITNSLKYAFNNDQPGEINIELIYHLDNNVTLIAADNGIGIPENIDLKNPATLGLQIITLLVKQLNGIINLTRTNGTVYKITFPLTESSFRH